jgi:ABC-2 type transport system permease protein
MRNVSAYLSFFRVRFINGLQYRAAAWAGVATQFAWGAMNILMYRAFYQSGNTAFPMTFQELTSYLWLQQSLLTLTMAWYFDNDILNSISSGNIAYELCRPADIYSLWFIKNLAVRVSRAALRCLPILIVAAFLPEPYNISLPASPEAGLMFLLSMILGTLVSVSINMLVYISAFYTISTLGVRAITSSLVLFLSGEVIPIPFFPEGLKNALYKLPFAAIQNTPFQIYNGHINGADVYTSILLQALWLIVLLAAGKLWTNKALKKTVVQGG